MIRIFKSAILAEQLTVDELVQLVEDFRQYKETTIPANYMGRDIPYDHMNTLPSVKREHVMHLHLKDGSQDWSGKNQYYRTSDKHLVYCQGSSNKNTYLLITMLEPEAHAKARFTSVMGKIADMAQNFRHQY
jgi:mRNA interferase YafO